MYSREWTSAISSSEAAARLDKILRAHDLVAQQLFFDQAIFDGRENVVPEVQVVLSNYR